MFDVFKKLLLARQMSIEKGKIEMLGQRMIIAPVYTFSYIIKNAVNQDEMGRLIYDACKHANNDPRGFTHDVSRKYKLRGEKLIRWMADIATTSGWGVINVVKVDEREKTAVVNIEDSPVAKFIGKSKHPVDHPIRGYMAGAAEVIFNDLKANKGEWVKYDYIETHCRATGNPFCSFKLMETESLKNSPNKKIRELFRRQIGD